MKVIFIRHASAEPAGADGDEARKLTAEGKAESKATAGALGVLGVRLDLILTSPLVRAVQTARVTAEVHAGAEVQVEDALAPPGDAEALRRRLAALNRGGPETVAVVGHAPSMDGFIAAVAASAEDIGTSLSKAGAACVLLPPPESSDPPELRWLMRREQLAMLAKA